MSWPPLVSASRTLTTPAVGRTTSGVLTAFLIAALLGDLVTGEGVDLGTVLLVVGTLGVGLLTLAVWRRRVELSDDGLTVHGLRGPQVLRWEEVTGVTVRAFVPGTPTPAGKQTRLTFVRAGGAPRSFPFSADTVELPPLLDVARRLVAQRPELADDATRTVLRALRQGGQPEQGPPRRRRSPPGPP